MPIYWRYLLYHYFRIFFLCLFSFIAILMTIRLDDIAGFAALGPARKPLLLFILYQIPYIVPIAIPISSLIAGVVLFSRLSTTHEITALRSGGISIKKILSPLMSGAAILTLFSFFTISEISTHSNLQSRKMLEDLMNINPIVLLQKAKIGLLKNSYFQMDPVKNGEAANNFIVVLKNRGCKRLALLFVESTYMEEGTLKFKNASLISTSEAGESFDNLLIENEQYGEAGSAAISKLFRKGSWRIANDHLKLSFLRLKMKDLKLSLPDSPPQKQKEIKKNLTKCYSDILRRISLGISPLTFTLIGLAFGMEIGRSHKKWSIMAIFSLASLSLILFFVGKQCTHNVYLSGTLFLFPHILNATLALRKLRLLSRGIE